MSIEAEFLALKAFIKGAVGHAEDDIENMILDGKKILAHVGGDIKKVDTAGVAAKAALNPTAPTSSPANTNTPA